VTRQEAALEVDPVRIQLIRSGLSSIVDEMCLAVVRTSRSSAVKEQMDFTTALCDRDGNVVAQGICIALHLGTLPDVIRTVLRHFPSLGPGDVAVLNDPYGGGTHLPDIYMVRPIFVEDELLAYAVVNMHHVDVGGRVAGSVAPDSTEIFQEGLRIPPLLYRRGGRLDESLRALLEANVRLPELVLGDLEAQENACVLAEQRLNELARRHGAATVSAYMTHLLDYAERMARAEIAGMPDGEFRFVDHLDDDGVGAEPVRIEVGVRIAGDEVSVDFSGR
jgi:N-methylhydantoinase B